MPALPWPGSPRKKTTELGGYRLRSSLWVWAVDGGKEGIPARRQIFPRGSRWLCLQIIHSAGRPAGLARAGRPSVPIACSPLHQHSASQQSSVALASSGRPCLYHTISSVRPARSWRHAGRMHACQMSQIWRSCSVMGRHRQCSVGEGTHLANCIPNSYLPLNSTTVHHCSRQLKRRKLRSFRIH